MGFSFNPFSKSEKTTQELEEENERLRVRNENEELKLSIREKEAMQRKLNENGLSVKKDFGGNLRKAWAWFKTH